jgi:hypothetical protein
MGRQLVKHSQIGSYWRIVIAIPVLLLVVGSILAATKTACTNRTEAAADIEPRLQREVRVLVQWSHWWHCGEFIKLANQKFFPTIENVTKKFLQAEQEHRIKTP